MGANLITKKTMIILRQKNFAYFPTKVINSAAQIKNKITPKFMGGQQSPIQVAKKV